MSNDQSPPARKVTPYKKGGRRQSPFSGMAFQFSGTALDVAIQQREQEGGESLSAETRVPETLAEDTLPVESQQADEISSEPQLNQLHNAASAADALSASSAVAVENLSLPPVNRQVEAVERHRPLRNVRLTPAKKVRPIAGTNVPPELQAFIDRWKPFLTDTQIGICAYIYHNSTAVNQDYCFTSTAKLMAAVSKTERQVKTVLNQLLDWDFLLKGETVVNAPREQRGTYYKLSQDKF